MDHGQARASRLRRQYRDRRTERTRRRRHGCCTGVPPGLASFAIRPCVISWRRPGMRRSLQSEPARISWRSSHAAAVDRSARSIWSERTRWPRSRPPWKFEPPWTVWSCWSSKIPSSLKPETWPMPYCRRRLRRKRRHIHEPGRPGLTRTSGDGCHWRKRS